METPHKQKQEIGLVAILDALGAAAYSDTEIERFLESRSVVLTLLDQKAEGVLGGVNREKISTFTFNDTIVILLKTSKEPTVLDVRAFFTLLRKFLIDSLQHGILFRGSIPLGTFYVNEDTNTVMGQAVTDAAAWYSRADWFGIHATPKATIAINALIEAGGKDTSHVAATYNVPMKDGTYKNLKVVNWPKGFFVKNVTPCGKGEKQKAKLLSLLTAYPIPIGVENKYTNSIAFFDRIVEDRRSNRRVDPKTTRQK